MTYLEAIFLGAVQGLTEFIPVSSSGHLILARLISGNTFSYDLAFDAVLQLATAFAVVAYFLKYIFELYRKGRYGDADDKKYSRKVLAFLVVGSLPAIAAGFALEGYMDGVFRSPLVVVVGLLVGTLIMYASERFHMVRGEINAYRGFVAGVFQCLALVPGFSRSGMTISGGLFSGLPRSDAVKMSFLLSFPIIMGSGVKKLLELSLNGGLADIAVPMILGSITAFSVGWWVIGFLIRYLQRHTFKVFLWYRLALSVVILAILYL